MVIESDGNGVREGTLQHAAWWPGGRRAAKPRVTVMVPENGYGVRE
jgi:hypothetical protein